MVDLQTSIVSGGFSDPVHDAQRVFAAVMQAMSRPGTVQAIGADASGPAPLYASTSALLQMLADADTPVWFDHAADQEAVRGWLSFHTGAPIAQSHADAAFAIIADPSKLPPSSMFALGSQEYPDRSTTLIVQVTSLDGGEQLHLSGPGIETSATAHVDGLPADFHMRWAENNALFPRGVDVVLASPDAVLGLPRTTRIQTMETA